MMNLTLCLLLQITGEVLDSAGQPAAGATVRLWRWDGETLPQEMWSSLKLEYHELAIRKTADDGRFRFDAREGRLYAVTAERGMDDLAVMAGRVGAGRRLALRFEKPVLLHGRIVYPVDGKPAPAAGAEVTATLDHQNDYDWPSRCAK